MPESATEVPAPPEPAPDPRSGVREARPGERFPVVLLWHMHQPEYRLHGRAQLPWVQLHALGAYSDMAAHLEAEPGAHAVVNFSPVLLEQLEDAAARLAAFAAGAADAGEDLATALRTLPPPGARRAALLQRCVPEHPGPRAARVPYYAALVQQLRAQPRDLATLDDATTRDLLVGFHLSWIGEVQRRADPRAAALMGADGAWSAADAEWVIGALARATATVLPRWRALADAGRVELSMSPQHHALLPLLLDFGAARDATPEVALPEDDYPGGRTRAQAQLRAGRATFERVFGRPPAGCWPSEAALSEDTVRLLDEAGFDWLASSGAVLGQSLVREGRSGDAFRAWQPQRARIACYFRDDGLSDQIGFAYRHWRAADAVADLTGHLQRIASPGRDLVLLALDGENAWEWFADYGHDFLAGAYRALATHPSLRLATLAQCRAQGLLRAASLPPVCAGSWVHGQLLTWIGHPEKNRAWSLLADAKRRYDAHAAHAAPSPELERRLGVCEASDWFWWPGDLNPAPAVRDFDALFRGHLASLYEGLGVAVPPVLRTAFASGTTAEVVAGGTMRPTAPAAAPAAGSDADVAARAPQPPWIARSAGVLAHISSLPSGRLGEDALRFVELLAAAGAGVWQVLPVGPRDAHDNPFQPPTAFAGDTTLLAEPAAQHAGFAAFHAANRDWLDDWALFRALKQAFGGAPWWDWPAPLRAREAAALRAARGMFAGVIARECRAQHAFATEWAVLRRHAREHGVRLFGDVPLFVAHDSADAWAHRELFELGEDGRCEAVVGVPPDAFSADGQLWGYPPYRWSRMRDTGFAWWRRRFEVQAQRFDLVRLDHFRGFAAWWRVPGGARTAAEGAWVEGPGAAAIECLAGVLHGAQLVAEDLGVITPDVVALRRRLGIPGMRVLQFAFDGDPGSPHLPAQHGADNVCYTGTHDNDTTLGWWQSLDEAARGLAAAQLGADPAMPAALVELALSSPAQLAVLPLQDLLGLGTQARMNRPGIAAGNWRWRFAWEQLPGDFAAHLRASLQRHGRLRE